MNEDKQPRIYVADTSILIQDPGSIEILADKDNMLVIPTCVLDEIDELSSNENGKGFAAREVNRKLDAYSSKSPDIRTPEGGKIIFVTANDTTFTRLVKEGLGKKNDTRIIAVALDLVKKNQGRVILVSCDLNLRVKARSKNLISQDYEHSKTETKVEELYTGSIQIAIKPEHFYLMTELCKEGTMPVAGLKEIFDFNTLLPNQCIEFVMLGDDNRSVYAMFKRQAQLIRWIGKLNKESNGKKKLIEPANKEQLFALALLRDPEIYLVSLIGPAGTGKTLMSLKGAWEQTTGDDDGFNCLTVFRPNIEIGTPLGFLPGDVDEKFEPWQRPIITNLGHIVNGGDGKSKMERSNKVKSLMEAGMVHIGPINFIRGDNFYREFIILDDGQNLTKSEMKALVTRIAFGFKFVVTGDLNQIDNPLVDQRSNGLIHLINSFVKYYQGKRAIDEIFGHVNMVECRRSKLAEIANHIL